MRKITIVLAVAGLALATVIIGWFGFGRVAETVARVGWSGFALFGAYQLAVFPILGLAWFVLVRKTSPRRVWVLVWGRMVRDSSGNLLPFSQLAGFVLGARAITLHGIEWPRASATTLVDVTAEVIAQVAFALFGLLILVTRAPQSRLLVPVSIALGVAAIGAGGFVLAQHGGGRFLRRLAPRLAGGRFEGASERFVQMHDELDHIYAEPARVALGTVLHLAGWFATGFGTWIAYRLVGAEIDLASAMAIEGLLAMALSAAFLIPNAAGVQEAAYAGLGALFGVTAELSLAVSLLRRARDIVVGVPVLAIWQGVEVRRLGPPAHMAPNSSTPQ